jgi:prefoldin subunit 5
MYERMTGIESAMPTLVEVQQHLADLPETMDELQARLGGLSDMLERLLASLDTLDANVAALREAIQPIGRIADRLPGKR